MTKKEVLAWNEECRKIVRNPEIDALNVKANKIDSDARIRSRKLRDKIEKLQADCVHVYNYNLSFACLKCGVFCKD